jgi:regulator of cell morphogenesis and NO signaling
LSNATPSKTVREIALQNPGAARVFEALRIDYCCGGGKSLAEACDAAKVSLSEVVAKLDAAPRDPKAAVWDDRSMNDLIDHILAVHHEHDRRELDRLRALSTKVASAHGARRPELERVRELVRALADDLEPHMMKEERVLFPYIRELDRALEGKGAWPNAFFGTVANPVAMMTREHDHVGALLRELRATTKDFALPEDACPSYTALFRALEEFERELHVHIHLENNVLFPRAIRGENKSAPR